MLQKKCGSDLLQIFYLSPCFFSYLDLVLSQGKYDDIKVANSQIFPMQESFKNQKSLDRLLQLDRLTTNTLFAL
jgi:hypothetical protein